MNLRPIFLPSDLHYAKTGGPARQIYISLWRHTYGKERTQTTRQQKILADAYAAEGSYAAAARACGATPYRVKHAVQQAQSEKAGAARAAPAENPAAADEQRREKMRDITDKLLDAMCDDDKIAKAPLNQLATAVRVFLKGMTDGENEEDGQLTEIIRAVRDLA